jgi:Ni/Fe-hydrogenase 1 B-type cytochrome subunit
VSELSETATREEHPLTAVVLHWAHLVSFLTLVITGWLIYRPAQPFPMGTVRTVHFVTMFVFILTTVVRIYWAFFGAGSARPGERRKLPDWRHFAAERDNRGTMRPTLAYYLFLRKTKPRTGKYNPLQKLTYGYVFPLGMVLMALTGFAIWEPTMGAMAWFTGLLGGLAAVRLVHFLGMVVLVMFWLVHIYLVVFEDVKELPLMMIHREPRPRGARTESAEARHEA